MSSERDNLKAGIFVVVGVALAMLVIFLLADFNKLFEPTQQVHVTYHLTDGIGDLKPGAVVSLGDQPVGTVLSITDILDHPSGRVIGKRVTLQIPERYTLSQDAIIELSEPLIGSGAKLNIRSVGQGEKYQPGTDIPGGLKPNAMAQDFVNNVGIEEAQRQQIQELIASLRNLAVNLEKDYPGLRDDVYAILDDVKPAIKDAREAMAGTKAGVSEARDMLARFNEHSETWITRLDSITANADSSLSRVNQLVQDKAPVVESALDDVKAVTEMTRQETMVQVRQMLEKADQAVTHARDGLQEAKSFIIAQQPVLARAFANFQLTGAQLKLAAIEVRRSPWRLLYQPKDEELESDNLYDAARSFALAAATIDAASASLQNTLEKTPDNKEAIEKRIAYLNELFERFEDAEKAFWEALDRPPSK